MLYAAGWFVPPTLIFPRMRVKPPAGGNCGQVVRGKSAGQLTVYARGKSCLLMCMGEIYPKHRINVLHRRFAFVVLLCKQMLHYYYKKKVCVDSGNLTI